MIVLIVWQAHKERHAFGEEHIRWLPYRNELVARRHRSCFVMRTVLMS